MRKHYLLGGANYANSYQAVKLILGIIDPYLLVQCNIISLYCYCSPIIGEHYYY